MLNSRKPEITVSKRFFSRRSDVFTDLALSLGLKEVFEFYQEEINKVYGASGAFATKNLPYLLERFSEWGLPSPVVMTHFNKNGFQMIIIFVSRLKHGKAKENEVTIIFYKFSGYLCSH